MSGTSWSTLVRSSPRSWLLTDGSVITEPRLEVSGSNRRVRVAGQPDTSTYYNDLHNMLDQAAHTFARQRGQEVLLETTRDLKSMWTSALSFDPGAIPSAILGPVHDPENTRNATLCWWRFRHPTVPQLEAYVTVTLKGLGNLNYVRSAKVWMPVRAYWGDTTDTQIVETNGAYCGNFTGRLNGTDEHEWDRWIEQNLPDWKDTLTLGDSTTGGARAAVKDLLKVVRAVEKHDSLELPDFTDVANPSYARFELVASNVNGQFISDMAEYLDGETAVNQALEHYQSLLTMLRSMGVDVQTPATVDNDFAAAMLSGQSGSLHMEVSNVVHPDEGREFQVDHEHTLSVHLPTGTFLVECNARPQDPDEIDQKWREAKTIARLTGEEDELLAYARKYAAEQRSGRAQSIVAVRS